MVFLEHTNRCSTGGSYAQPLLASYDDPVKAKKLVKGVVLVTAQSTCADWKDHL